MNTDEPCAETVKSLRASLKLSQQAFGALFGFSIVSVSHWENGHAIRDRFSATVLEFTENALAVHPPDAVLTALRSAGAKPAALVRILVWLESNPARPPLPGAPSGGRPASSGREPTASRRR